MSPKPPTREQDLDLLDILDMYYRQGISTPKIAKLRNTTKHSIIGKLHRFRKEQIFECNCTKPENKDGGMPPRWWEK